MDKQAIVPEVVQATPATLVDMAINQGADLDKLERLMLLKERWEANEARKAYADAMAKFKADPPKIEKNRHVQYSTSKGTVNYHHADLFEVTEKINAALSLYGLHASWTTAQVDKIISVTCKISHIMGHSESTTLSSSPDDSGGKNSIQAIGSAVTYLQRYTLLALTGLATSGMDDDGRGEVEYISEKQQSTILDFIDEKGVDKAKFLEYMATDSIEHISTKDFNKAVTALKAAKGGKK